MIYHFIIKGHISDYGIILYKQIVTFIIFSPIFALSVIYRKTFLFCEAIHVSDPNTTHIISYYFIEYEHNPCKHHVARQTRLPVLNSNRHITMARIKTKIISNLYMTRYDRHNNTYNSIFVSIYQSLDTDRHETT